MKFSPCLLGSILVAGSLGWGTMALLARDDDDAPAKLNVKAGQDKEPAAKDQNDEKAEPGGSPFPGDRAPDVAAPVKPDKPKKIGPNLYKIGKIQFDRKAATISFDGKVNQTDGAIEYLIVTSAGKTHESLLVAPIKPFNLQIALLLMGAKPSLEMFPHLSKELHAKATLSKKERWKSLFTMDVSWTPRGRAKRTVDIGAWIRNVRTMDRLKKPQFQFGGSRIVEGRLVAQADGSAVAIYQDSGALANYTGSGHDNDEEWFPADELMPRKGTPVMVTIKLKKKPVVKP